MSSKYKWKIRYEHPVDFSIEIALENIESLLKGNYVLSVRAVGLLILQNDVDMLDIVKRQDRTNWEEINRIINETKTHYDHPLDYMITLRRQEEVNDIVDKVVTNSERRRMSLSEILSQLTMHPVTGIPVLLAVLYFGFYKFVGGFGSGTLVDFLESFVFEEHLNPWITTFVNSIIPWLTIQDLFAGEYGVLTLGLRYAVAIILPIVAMFFLVFSVIEDSGYLPRLAMLIDRLFKSIGLSGRAVIPMVLGFGCDTMATMVTRTLPTKKERIISTMLLSLAIPCSAQLGVILAMLEGNNKALLIWGGTIVLVFLFIGFLTSKVVPGGKPSFYMEVPPLRLPKISNVLVKTYTRVQWYFQEIFLLFLFASFLIWLGQLTGVFDYCVNLLVHPVRLIGLPDKTAEVFLFGFFRRDYGVAGLYDLNKAGLLTGVQLVVSCITLTLFLPCIAQFLMNVKERGIKTGIGMSLFVLFFSFGVAFIVNYVLNILGVVI